MSNLKVLVSLAVFGLCCLTFAHSLRCNTCFSAKECKKPIKADCNQLLANQTRDYLQAHYTGVPSAISYTFECIQDWLKIGNQEYMHHGCVYSNYRTCSYSVNPYYAPKYERKCYQCPGDRCNPADRTSVSLLTVLSTIIVTTLVKCIWRN